jgi:hypothetical protein
MHHFLIEREIPGAGAMTPEQLRDASRTSCNVLRSLGTDIQWIESFVSGDRIHCHYLAPDETLIRAHAEQSGFPATRIFQIHSRIDPTTAAMQV